jgi:hydrogenase-4 component B
MGALLAALAILAGTAAGALALARWRRAAAALAAAGVVAAAVLALTAAVHCLRAGGSTEIAIPWAVPLGTLRLGLDPLTAFFLIPLFGLAAPCAIHGAAHLHRGAALAGCFFNLTVAAMTAVLLARDGVVLLVAWEVMTVASYLLVVLDHQQAEVRRAGWVYLVAGHLGVAFLFALVLLLARTSGDFGFAGLAAGERGTGVAAVAFVLALVGFGVKAGVVPLHIWLPEAHAAAPSHVSALMSGALIKLGLYGLLRASTFLTPRPFWGTTLLVLGLGGGLLGIALAIYQRDVKRALAYSSIENMGIILIGLGIGWWGLTHGHPRVGALGLAGGLLHVWNHAALKGLLFLCAGNILHGAGGKDLERLGGLLRRMPWTGTLMLTGAVGIAGLPPLNAFASEWLIYLGLFQGGLATRPGLMPLFAAAGLASMGAMAALCFLRLTGIALLGQPRSPAAAGAHEAGRWMLAPMLALVAAAAAMSVAAPRLIALVAPAAAQVAGVPVDLGAAADALRPVGLMNGALCALVLLAALILGVRIRRPARSETWGCGYLAPSARMQYTGRSFAELMAERLLPRAFRARTTARPPTALFAEPATLSADRTDPLTRAAYQPFFDRWAQRLGRLRWLQQGLMHFYILYILLFVVGALAWASLRRWWLGG